MKPALVLKAIGGLAERDPGNNDANEYDDSQGHQYDDDDRVHVERAITAGVRDGLGQTDLPPIHLRVNPV